MSDNSDSMKGLESPHHPQPPGRIAAVIGWLANTLPTLAILTILGGLAYWGHRTGWTVPKFSTVAGKGQAEKDDWCVEHSVPESICVACNPELMPKQDFGWSKRYGVQNCPLEHPEVAQLRITPRITQTDHERAQRALAFSQRPENNPKCNLYFRRLQFASEEAVEKVDLDFAPVVEAPMIEAVAASGEVGYDQTRVARIGSRVSGRVWWVPKKEGDTVKRGELVAVVDAAEVGKAKSEFLQAAVEANLKEIVLANSRKVVGAIAERTIQENEAALQTAEARLLAAEQILVNLGLPVRASDVKNLGTDGIARYLQFAGLPESVTKTLDPKLTTTNLLPVVAPLDGVVVFRDAVAGEQVDAAKVLFIVADTRRMWLTLNLRLEDANLVALDQPVHFRPDGTKADVTGKVAWKSTAVDQKTRTVKVRAELNNPDGRLHAATFGTGRVVLREEPNAIVVPSEAVHQVPCSPAAPGASCHIVFVRDKDFLKEDAYKVCHVRTVRVGAKDEQNTEIIVGVIPGEVVVTKGSGVLRGELLKNSLGAG